MNKIDKAVSPTLIIQNEVLFVLVDEASLQCKFFYQVKTISSLELRTRSKQGK